MISELQPPKKKVAKSIRKTYRLGNDPVTSSQCYMEPVRSGTTIDSHESRKRTTKKKASQDGRGAPEPQASSNLPGDYQLGDLSSTHYMAPEVGNEPTTTRPLTTI